ncbi:hypothetical protein SELMODRAFT_115591 [Selaginella moellendorffii]|uniref:Pentacotripeptide-repeat region of PRORP domain-containing protein n=1 Tax=Selaginella moellendorffii TaxID=88036 RepID=D8SEZ4_SELML|nr:hypothetical protein SELMODRAFT_115591 [Selaginella moellendorffii]
MALRLHLLAKLVRHCGSERDLCSGRRIHLQILASQYRDSIYLSNLLIDMYSKCLSLDEAERVFQSIKTPNVFSWNILMAAYSQHGLLQDAIALLAGMVLYGMRPSWVTFVGLLYGCSHAGKVPEGVSCFRLIEELTAAPPTLDHFVCAIDLFGRSKRLDEAEDLLDNMPFKEDVVACTTLLGACQIHGDAERGTRIARRVVEFQQDEACPYVLLSSAYIANRGRL